MSTKPSRLHGQPCLVDGSFNSMVVLKLGLCVEFGYKALREDNDFTCVYLQ